MRKQEDGCVKMICYIIGAREPGPIFIEDRAAALVIAADGGLHYLQQQNIMPDLIVGDFDSLGRIPSGNNIIRHPVEKDDTDTMLAVKLGLERGCRTFVLYGCTGGRPDHTYANYQTLLFLAEHGARGYLVGEDWISCVIQNDTLEFPPTLDGTISVFCPNGEAHGVTLRGLYYSLENGSLYSEFPLGVSNQFTEDEASISVRDGSLLVMWEEPAERLILRLL